ncbi:MAG: tetratricopeptide repeat protein [Gemmatimonadota bacterium]
MNLIEELKRRSVFRVAAAYAVVGWLLIQVVNEIAEPLGLPGWFPTGVIVMMGVGFPLAVILAWAFDLTPAGVKRAVPAGAQQATPPRRGSPLTVITITGLVLGLGYFVWESRFAGGPDRADSPPGPGAAAQAVALRSIAVLPFQNMSGSRDNEYFSDGITEEILNALVRVPGLSVASRTSSFTFKNPELSAPEIAGALDVGYLLEGSVRRDDAGGRVRITAQLIDGASDRHLWSDTYDRDLADIFAVQEEIARTIAAELQLSLELGADEALIESRTDADLYETYLRAVELYRARGENLREALHLLEGVVEADPAYEPAWSTLAAAYIVAPAFLDEWNDDIPAAGAHGRAAYAADRAYDLSPRSPNAMLRQGQRRAFAGDYVRALALMEEAAAADPNNDVLLEDLAQFTMMAGYVERARRLFERLVEIAPDNLLYRTESAEAIAASGDLEDAIRVALAVHEADPTFTYAIFRAAQFMVAASGPERASTFLRDVQGAPAFAELTAKQRSAFRGLAELLEDAVAGAPSPVADPSVVAFSGEILLATHGLEEFMQWVGRQPIKTYAAFDLLATRDPAVLSDPRTIGTIRDAGLEDLWRARGWPELCSPSQDASFTCGLD